MEKYEVINRFRDTDGHIYEVGDSYPAEGKKATKKRIETLSTTKNKYKKIYIKKVDDTNDEKITPKKE